MADLPQLGGVDFRMFRGKSDHANFARIITAWYQVVSTWTTYRKPL